VIHASHKPACHQEQHLTGYLQFWGKAGGVRPGEPAWHPNAYHCLDVAAVADALLIASPRKLVALSSLLGTSPANARRLLVCLIALHDIGKFACSFQKKCPEAWPTCVLGDLAADQNFDNGRHDQIGFDLHGVLAFRKLLSPAFPVSWDKGHISVLWAAVAGHHGKPVSAGGSLERPQGMSTAGLGAALAFATDAAQVFGPFDALAEPDTDRLATLSWAVAGLTVIADWVGSKRDQSIGFPYALPNMNLAEYWLVAQTRAGIAIRAAGILPVTVDERPMFTKLFQNISAPSPLQRHVIDCTLPTGPSLTIIEDVTGSGKTEAALMLAARLMAEGRADGLFFALPTMATANAMYDRLSVSYRRLFADQTHPSLVLAHGRSSLNQDFTESIFADLHLKPQRQAEAEGDESGAACAAWIADDRRKAFFAHVGVGTIDQALLGVLPSKHQSLRLWGLSDRVLIIDEAHAYDAYMSREMARLLEFHAALGGSAIVLSATLPSGQRDALGASFAKGLGVRFKSQSTNDYPLLMNVSSSGSTSTALSSRPDRERTLAVRRIATAEDAVAHVVAMVERGASVAWIRNAVDDAIEAVESLRTKGLDPVLLHARFAMGDRLDIETRVARTLGKPGATEQHARPKFVVVGTQILEQSLDYDVDAMITDLAPIDLMIQRAGRLWRHSDRTTRPVPTPELQVLSLDPADVLDRDWYRQVSKRGAAVYDHHGLVWRSAKVLFDAGLDVGAIETPGGVRRLVEAVYANDDFTDVPEPLQKASNDADGRRRAERSIAGANLLRLENGYGGQYSQIWSSDTITPTRLGEPVTVFRMGRLEGDRVVPNYRDETLRRAWALSEVSLNRKKAKGVPIPKGELAKQIAAAKATWPEWEQDQPLLLLDRDGDSWRAVVVDKDDVEKPVTYDKRIGLRIVTSS
jgi:CRISPR-associated endonuclease/helicase Cas3